MGMRTCTPCSTAPPAWPPRARRACRACPWPAAVCGPRPPHMFGPCPLHHPAVPAQHQAQQPWHAQLDRHMPSLPDRTSVCPTLRPQIQQFPLLRDWTPPVMRHELAAELR